MAKMFYSAKEAAEKLGKSENDLKDLVRAGKLREFRDAGTVNYKVSDVDALAPKGPGGAASKPAAPAPARSGVVKSPAGSKAGSSIASASQSGEILLEPADDSGISLMPSGSDIMSLEAVDADDTAVGARAAKKKKEGSMGGSSSVPSVGINVFDDDELDEHVDPLAQTAVTDVAGLAMDGIGSGSGILDLTRESDDTSLGAELLEEIYTGDETIEETGGTMEMGDDTRAGLDEAVGVKEKVVETVTKRKDKAASAMGTAISTAARTRTTSTTVTQVVEYGPDAASTALTAAMAVAVAIMWIGGLASMALLQGVTPSLLSWMNANLMIVAGAAVGLTGIAAAIAYLMAKRSS